MLLPPLYNPDLPLHQPVQLVDKRIDLPVGGLDLASILGRMEDPLLSLWEYLGSDNFQRKK
jgi:hypothetical protein